MALPLPLNILLCRLAALLLLLTWEAGKLQSPFLPFIPVPDEFPLLALQGLLVAGCLATLFTTRVALAAAFTGSTLLLALLSSRAYFNTSRLFLAILLLLAALGQIRLIRWQLVISYIGYALSSPWWLLLTASIRWPWLSALAQCALFFYTGDLFTFLALQLALLAFADWPTEPVTVIWDGDCGFCAKSKRFYERFDFDHAATWAAQQTGIGERWGISMGALQGALHSVTGTTVRQGYKAVRGIIVLLPLFWYATLAALVFAPRPTIVALLFFLSPLSNWPGEALYRWVARNRHRFGDQTCALP